MNASTNTEKQAECEPLLDLAAPHIYRRNLFRVLGLSVRATPKDVQRQQNRRKMHEKLGVASSNGHAGPLALNPAPDEHELRSAMERLNRPLDRLLDEIFWFWPVEENGGPDAALKALEQGDVERARHTWLEQAKIGDAGIAAHNLAVLDHLAALDCEARLATSGLDQEYLSLADLWPRAFARWKGVFEDEDFWRVLRDRVRGLNDAQLSTGFVRRVRSTLPTAILLISAKIACGAAERADSALAQRHLRIIREADFGDGLADEAIGKALKPVRDRIKTATDNARGRWTEKPHEGNRHLRDLHQQVKSLLVVVDTILPAESLTRAGLHDSVAKAMLDGQIAFGNKTNDWTECIKLLELAEDFAIGDRQRSELSENIEILKNNAKSGNDWYSPGYWDLPGEIIAQLEAAFDKIRAGDRNGAIKDLVTLDPNQSDPWRRCLAFSLSQYGWQIANEGFEEFGSKPTLKIQKFLEVLSRVSIPLPNAQMQSWQLPDCPCCSREYTTWVNGEHKGQRFWMCGACSAEDDQEREVWRKKLRLRLSAGLEYLLLAVEIDKHDPGLRESAESLKRLATELRLAFYPGTAALRRKLRIPPDLPSKNCFSLALWACSAFAIAGVVIFFLAMPRGASRHATVGTEAARVLAQPKDEVVLEPALAELPHATREQTLQGHTEVVNSVAFSPDGKTLASGSNDGSVRVWDVQEASPLYVISGHSAGVYSVAFSPVGNMLASASVDKTICLWDTQVQVNSTTPKKVMSETLTSGLLSVVFSPNGVLASGSDDGHVIRWGRDTGSSLAVRFRGKHHGGVWSVAFSPDGKTLASGSVDKTIQLWDTEKGNCVSILRGSSDVYSVSFSVDGKTLASGGRDRMVRLWNVQTGQEIRPFAGHSESVTSVAFSPDGQTLASGSRDKTIRVWDIRDGRLLATLEGHQEAVTSIVFSPDGKTLASGSEDKTVKLWSIE